jgi:hypothetical protein
MMFLFSPFRWMGLLVGLSVLGCVTGQQAPATEPAAFDVLGRNVSDEADSLFKGDSVVLSDAEIERILSFDFKLHDANRIAVLAIEGNRYWSEEYAKAQSANETALLTQLKGAHGVSDVALLPALLIPDKKTVPRLREAAARFQADLLLVYQARVHTYSKYRTMGKDEVKAQCTVEAILLDVRTGIIPYSKSATEEVSATRAESDLNFSETVANATAKSVGAAMNRVGADVVAFLQARRGSKP